jgi:hypothetical protein
LPDQAGEKRLDWWAGLFYSRVRPRYNSNKPIPRELWLEATMTPKPETVVRADRILQQSETIEDHESRAKQLKEAFDLLNAYLKENPVSEQWEYVQKRKQSHMRSHLRRLSQLTEPDRETWVHNFILFAVFEEEVSHSLDQHPELRSWYDAFRRSHVDWAARELVPRLQRAGNKH